MRAPESSETLEAASRVLRAEGRVVLCHIVRTEGSTPGKAGWKMLVRRDGECFGNLGGGAFEAMVQADARAMAADRAARPAVKRYYLTEDAVRGEPTGMVCGGMAEVFLEVVMARPILVICGGGPVGQAIAHNGALCGFDLLVADDRPEFRRSELFPEGCELAEVDRDFSQDFLRELGGRELYVTVVTRCWETDLAALDSVLRQRPEDLVYLGLMGSRRKVERVREELAVRGRSLDPEVFHGPIGLPIGGDSPGEIAVSILAEIIQTRSDRSRSPSEAVANETANVETG